MIRKTQDEDEDSEEDEDEEGEEEEEEDPEAAARLEAEAQERVRSLLFSALATKRVDGDNIQMDMLAEPNSTPTTSVSPTTTTTSGSSAGSGQTGQSQGADSGSSSSPAGQSSKTEKSAGKAQASREELSCKVVVVSEPSLGMVLRKGGKGEAVVASLSRGSVAAKSGVEVGDTVVGINAVRTADFNQVLWLLKHVERPMHLVLLPPKQSRS